ncbi:hypothetical protein [Kitasatospora sp. MBT66]|uniref:hypothetical protein n=1 Tax=Kitasatospora sp. MBT66 TaxID=1444769 RepID=UPI00068D84F6|nr:hypothetical protein [Kitasatospora sp. MBT66]
MPAAPKETFTMPAPDPSDLPAEITALPRDPRNGLPIPAVNRFGDSHDFTTVNGAEALRLGAERCCGVCTRPLAELVAFIGGTKAAEARTFSDPPMHPACAEAAITLCPHIARSHARRASERRAVSNPLKPTTASGWSEDKPELWIIGLTRHYRIEIRPTADGDRVAVFVAHPFTNQRTFGYDSAGRIAEQR